MCIRRFALLEGSRTEESKVASRLEPFMLFLYISRDRRLKCTACVFFLQKVTKKTKEETFRFNELFFAGTLFPGQERGI